MTAVTAHLSVDRQLLGATSRRCLTSPCTPHILATRQANSTLVPLGLPESRVTYSTVSLQDWPLGSLTRCWTDCVVR